MEKVIIPSATLNIGVPNPSLYEKIYITGNIKELGEWNPLLAIVVKRSKRGSFSKKIQIPVGTKFEFKILSGNDFTFIEKGQYGEELPNRHGEVTEEKTKLVIEVKSFSKS